MSAKINCKIKAQINVHGKNSNKESQTDFFSNGIYNQTEFGPIFLKMMYTNISICGKNSYFIKNNSKNCNNL